MRYYPVFLDLRGRLAVVVGDGAVALEKIEGLLEAGARVRAISARPSVALAEQLDHPEVTHRARPYRAGDLADAFLVFAERIDPITDQAIFDEADALGIPVNVQDDTPRCSFIAASLVRRGDLTVAISTAGRAPALAVRLRQRLERELGPHIARFLELAGSIRRPLAAAEPDFETRRDRWYRLVDSDVLERLARGDERGAQRRFHQIMGVRPAEPALGTEP